MPHAAIPLFSTPASMVVALLLPAIEHRPPAAPETGSRRWKPPRALIDKRFLS